MKNILRFALVSLAFATAGLFAQAAVPLPSSASHGHEQSAKITKKAHKKHKKHKKTGV